MDKVEQRIDQIADDLSGAMDASVREAVAELRQIAAALREQAGTPEGLSADEREWLEYAIDHMRDDSEPEDLTCADVLEALLQRSAASPSPPVEQSCTCPSGDGSLRWPCPQHPPVEQAARGGVDDTARMDWLEGHDVEVREPLLYGSRGMFHAQRVSDDDEPYRNGLRAQIDSYLSGERHG